MYGNSLLWPKTLPLTVIWQCMLRFYHGHHNTIAKVASLASGGLDWSSEMSGNFDLSLPSTGDEAVSETKKIKKNNT